MQCRKSCIVVRTGILWLGSLLLTSALVFLAAPTQIKATPPPASPCTVAWDPSPGPSVSGYAFYYGVAGSATTNRLDVGPTNQVTLNNLAAGSEYVFFVAAYNASLVEGAPSAVMCYTPSVISALKPTLQANGAMDLHFHVATGAVCHVEYSPSLSPPDWQTLVQTQADANGNVFVSDPLTNKPSTRFYRAAVP